VALSELKDHTMVTTPAETHLRRLVESAAAAAGFSLKYSVVVGWLPTMLDHVVAAVGPAIVPCSVLPPKPWRGFEAYPLSEPSLHLSAGIITLNGRYLAPAATALMTLVRNECRTAPQAAAAG
jgi:DNA-binding transcriptional LysR family regulator